MKLLSILFSIMMTLSSEPIIELIDHSEQFEWYFEGAGIALINAVYLEKDSSLSTEYTYYSGNEKRIGKNTFRKNDSGKYQGFWKTISNNGNSYEGELILTFNADGTAKGYWISKWTNEKRNIKLSKKIR